MNSLFLKNATLSLCLGMMVQVSHSAAIPASSKVTKAKSTFTHNHSAEKPSLIEKALIQQKRTESTTSPSPDEVKVLNAIRVQPTQNFFAAQHQRFSLFVQSLFSSQKS